MRITGALDSLIRGVSEQVPHDRLPGQFWAQDNMISDPVRGLSRRHGSRMCHELYRPTVVNTDATKADAAGFKEQSFSLEGTDYSLAYRAGQRPTGSTMEPLVLTNLDTQRLIPVTVGAGDTKAQQVLQSGISSVVAVGRFILMASRTHATTYTTVDRLAATAGNTVVWVKGGAYSRTFTVRVYLSTGALFATVSYTTLPSYYQGVLDTSDIPTSDPDYQKKVNDRIHAYNTAVNQHLAMATASIQPSHIAEQLRAGLAGHGVFCTRDGSHIRIDGIHAVDVSDGGNGDYIKGVAKEVSAVTELTDQHLVGKVVRVVPRSGGATQQAYYVKAEAKRPGQVGYGDVVWVETAGMEVRPGFVFLLGAIDQTNGIFYVASTPALLSTLAGIPSVPGFEPSSAGDFDSQPLWQFLGNTISHLRLFQDRLVIVAGATVFMSRSGGDYFNFFRTSALTITADDPIEIFAEGSEGDVISAGVSIDRNLLLFGRRQQYAIPGREMVTPMNAFIAVQSAHEDATQAPPAASGNLVFFAQQRDSRLTLQQLQTGAYADTFEAFDISPQLDGYMRGTPQQIVAMTSPSMVFIRTKEQPDGLYVYSFLDTAANQERLFDSWSRWDWAPGMGTLVSISANNSSLYAVFLRDSPTGAHLVLDVFSRTTQLSTVPYLDSWRPWVDTWKGTIMVTSTFADQCSVALTDAAGDYALLGRPYPEASILWASLPNQQANAVVGFDFTAAVEPTAPFNRDQKDKAILDCRMTLTKYVVTVSHSAALRAELRPANTPISEGQQVANWIHRPAGQWIVNTQQVAEVASVTIPIMREIREHRLRITSRSWLPLTLSSIEWSAQFFTARRR